MSLLCINYLRELHSVELNWHVLHLTLTSVSRRLRKITLGTYQSYVGLYYNIYAELCTEYKTTFLLLEIKTVPYMLINMKDIMQTCPCNILRYFMAVKKKIFQVTKCYIFSYVCSKH